MHRNGIIFRSVCVYVRMNVRTYIHSCSWIFRDRIKVSYYFNNSFFVWFSDVLQTEKKQQKYIYISVSGTTLRKKNIWHRQEICTTDWVVYFLQPIDHISSSLRATGHRLFLLSLGLCMNVSREIPQFTDFL